MLAFVFSVLWLGGLGSLVAIPMALLALWSGDIGTARRRTAVVALVLSGAGLAAGIAIASTSL